MRLGEEVMFNQWMVSPKAWGTAWDKGESLSFARANGIKVKESPNHPKGVHISSKWRVQRSTDLLTGLICGVRHIDITGHYSEDGWMFGKRKKVYLVAVNLTKIYRVPEEFIIREGRKVEKFKDNEWVKVEFKDLSAGDLFRLFDGETRYVDKKKKSNIWIASSAPYKDEQGVWTINTWE